MRRRFPAGRHLSLKPDGRPGVDRRGGVDSPFQLPLGTSENGCGTRFSGQEGAVGMHAVHPAREPCTHMSTGGRWNTHAAPSAERRGGRRQTHLLQSSICDSLREPELCRVSYALPSTTCERNAVLLRRTYSYYVSSAPAYSNSTNRTYDRAYFSTSTSISAPRVSDKSKSFISSLMHPFSSN